MDTFARALLSTPRDIQTTGGLEWQESNKPEATPVAGKRRPGRPPGPPTPKPPGMVEACAICWYIGQISHTPITWAGIHRWVKKTYGYQCHPGMISHYVIRHGKKRRPQPTRLPPEIMRECMQLVIVLRLHGYKQPWLEVVDRLWVVYRIQETNRSISNLVMGWAGLRGPRSHQKGAK